VTSGLLEAGVAAAGVAAVLTPIARAVARRLGVLDHPNERSSHTIPTPRNGGYAIVSAIAVGTLTAGAFRDRQLLIVVGASLALILVAAIDEVRTLPRVGRLIAQLLVGGAVAVVLAPMDLQVSAPYAAALLGTAVLWTVWMTNAFNFIDGINGIASSAAVVTGVTMAVMFSARGDSAAAGFAIAIAGAAAGFLAWNMTGSIFMGDIGSSTLGFLFASLVLRALQDAILLPAILPLMPILFDATLTVTIRAAQGERFFSTPHRSHCYQLLVQSGWSHAGVTALWTGLAIACAAVGLGWPALGAPGRTMAIIALFAVHAAVFALSRRETIRRLVWRDDLR
jgi:UDP-N-acetylmuramyl pentapeptide phosphotransferase/UDP-N-acetylglucosamine-1-phosphate transferase